MNQKGFSLVEILAAIVIVGLIAGPFLALFIQSAQTGKFTKKISDATYVAQSEMEKVYHLSTTKTFEDSQIKLESDHYQRATQNCGSNDICFTKLTGSGKHYIHIELKELEDSLYDIVTKVYKTEKMKYLEAQMETIYLWEK